MSSITKYLVYGPNDTLRRLAPKLFSTHEPKFLYKYESQANKDEVYVGVYEQYEKRINATTTLTCIIECKESQTRIEIKKAGGRMGFRGSSLTEEKNIEADVIDFIMDYAKRFGLSIQEIVTQPAEEES